MRHLRPLPLVAALGTALASLVLGGAAADTAAAHVRLTASDPGAGAVLSRAPDAIRLRFSEPLAPSLSSAHVLAPDGREVNGVRARVDPRDPRVLVVALPRLGRGAYSTLWRAVGTTDPHRARGLLVFRAGPGAAPASSAPRESPPVLAVLLRWLDFALLAGVIGALAVVGVVLGPGRRRAEPTVAEALARARGRLLTLAAGCAATALMLGIFVLPLRALVLIAWEPRTSLDLLGQTRWGGLWLAREALLTALLVVVLVLRRAAAQQMRARAVCPPETPGPALLLAGALAAGVAVVRALDGHAAEVAPQTALSVLALTLHVLAAGVWVGGVLALAVGFWPLLHRAERADTLALLRTVWRPFGRLAALSVGLLVVTGLYTAGRQVASVDALVTTLYGQALGAKSVLLTLTGGLGLLTAAVVHPALARRLFLRRRPRLRTLIAGEVAAGLAVFLVAGLMSSAPPARGHDFDATPVPKSMTAGGGDVLVTLSATPNRPGQNVLTAVVASTRRPDPPPPTGVDLRFGGGATRVAMREVGPGRFLLAGDQLSASGRSHIELAVHRRGEADRSVGFAWRTAPAPRRVVISDRPLEPLLTLAAALLALAGATAIACLVLRRPRSRRRTSSAALLSHLDARKEPS
jgi:copper transport protein